MSKRCVAPVGVPGWGAVVLCDRHPTGGGHGCGSGPPKVDIPRSCQTELPKMATLDGVWRLRAVEQGVLRSAVVKPKPLNNNQL